MTFRGALRSWLAEHMTAEIAAAGQPGHLTANLELMRAWNRDLADAGWAAPAWPTEYGGKDAGVDDQLAYFEEMSQAEAPGPVNVIGVSNIAPAIMSWGTDEQRERHLRPMLRGDEIWSQGMSEPDAGSDLASLRTSAVADGDDFIINGQKTWNSLGHLADWCQLYVRTDPAAPKHKGISCLLVDMTLPGIEARPLRTMTGEESFSELFFDDVRVPRSALLGPAEGGWNVAMTTLSHERAGVARLHLSLSRKLDRLLAEPGAIAAMSDPRLRDRVAVAYSRIACMRWMTDRALAGERLGQPSAGMGGLAKLAWARAEQELASLSVALLGLGGLADWAFNLCSSPGSSIAGGTNEINRNVVAEHVLGLPRS